MKNITQEESARIIKEHLVSDLIVNFIMEKELVGKYFVQMAPYYLNANMIDMQDGGAINIAQLPTEIFDKNEKRALVERICIDWIDWYASYGYFFTLM